MASTPYRKGECTMSIPYVHDTVCLNVLAFSLENARNIYEAAEGHVLAGVLSSSYPDVQTALTDMQQYHQALNGCLSVGLGGGNPMQWKAVCDIARDLKTAHYNQIFPMTGCQRFCVGNDEAHINALVSPSGTPGYVKVSTGPLSQYGTDAIIPVDTAILMIKEMGGNALKFFPMNGLSCRDELQAAAEACAAHDFIMEPTGGIDLQNYEEILTLILNCGVKHVIPHIYSSIIDPVSKETRIEDVARLYAVTKKVLQAA